MKSIASAPGKAILFGEHFVVYGSKAILAAIEKRVTVTTTNNEEKTIVINSILDSAKLPLTTQYTDVKSTLRPFFYLAKKMINEYNHNQGLEISIDSEIPPGVGLGSSSACCVAAAGSISGFFEKKSIDEVLNLAIDAEKTIFANTSGADCSVCTYGGLIEYDKENGFKRLDIKPDFDLVIVNSNISHSTDEVVSRVKKFKDENPEFEKMCIDVDKLISNANQALSSNDLQTVGEIMHQNQEFLEKIGISNEKLRSIINIAKNNAYGAKITGAGDGGCIIALADEANREKIINDFKNNGFDCFSVKIDSKGLV